MALEHETEAILRILVEKTIGEQSSCRLDAVSAPDVPQGIRSFFRAETRRRLEEDMQKSSWFAGIQTSTAGSARLAQALILSLTDAYQFSRREFLDTLDLAVHFVANYLCRPQWTLVNFLFDRSPRSSVASLSQGLTYVADYRYLGELAVRSLQHRSQHEISREEFQVLIGRIDEEVVRLHSARELAALTRPLFAFFQTPGNHPDGAIPVEALLVFFDDKRLHTLKDYLRGMCQLRSRTHVTFDELTRLVEDLYSGKSLPTEAGPSSADDAPSPVPASAPTEATAEEPPPAPAHERAPSGVAHPKANIALSLTFAGLQESATPRTVPPELSTLIQPEQRDRFIAHLFNGDASLYARTLDALDALTTWRDAEAHIEELCHASNLDPRAGEMAEFADTVRRRYAVSERTPK